MAKFKTKRRSAAVWLGRREIIFATAGTLLLLVTVSLFRVLGSSRQQATRCQEQRSLGLPSSNEKQAAREGTPPDQRSVNASSRSNASEKELGYFLALKYYEQQTQATRNFFQMQCLASSYGMRVVEPFLHNSQIAVPLEQMAQGYKPLPFGDLINMTLWNEQTTMGRLGYRTVSTWQEFLQRAPREVVLLCMKYRNPPQIHIPVPGYDFRRGCSDGCFKNLNSAIGFLESHGFHTIKQACVNFADYAGSVADESFEEQIFGTSVKKKPVTVVANEFRGFFGLYRMQLLSPCGILSSLRAMNVSVMPSKRLVEDSTKYVTRNFNDRPYVSILARVERIVLHSFLNLSSCAEEVAQLLEKFRRDHNLQDHFLAMDIGKYGSRGAAVHQNLQAEGKKLFQTIFSDRWTFSDWEDSFALASSADNPAYIANLQRTVAAKGACLIMLGGGGFQAQARSLYERYHPGPPDSWCVYKVCAQQLDGT